MMTDKNMYVRVLRERWWIIVVVTAAALLAAQHFTARQTRSYRATASATVAPSPELTETADLLRALETLERRTVLATFALLPRSRETTEAAAAALGLQAGDLSSYRISAAVVPNTNVIRIVVEGADAKQAAEVANAVSAATAVKAARLYRLFAVAPLDAAVPLRAAVSPDPKRNMMVAGILGLFLGLAMMLGAEAVSSLVAHGGERRREPRAQPDAA